MFFRSAAFLAPAERAAYATASRLLSCLVTESLLNAIFVKGDSNELAGTAIVLTSEASQRGGPYSSEDIFAVIPLRHVPIFKPRNTQLIGLLDPFDMLPYIFELTYPKGGHRHSQNGHIQVSAEVILMRDGIARN